jgi:CO/xanthine dehydrogenase Mo-binding subunit
LEHAPRHADHPTVLADLDEDPAVGDAEVAFSGAPVTVDAHYATPTQHHNPIELFTTSCA